MQPTIDLGPITLQTFGIAFASGFIVAGAVLARHLKELGKPVEWAYEMILYGLVGGVVGARVYYIAINYSTVEHDFLGHLFSGSGLVWYGGAIGGAIAVVVWAHPRPRLNLHLLDLAPLPPTVGYAGRRGGGQLS